MDIISHGLWGGAAFGRKNKHNFLASFIFGIGPDFIAFAPFFVSMFLGLNDWPGFSTASPVPGTIPNYVFLLYQYSHSLIIFAVIFLLIWAFLRKPLWESLAWPLHILLDIPLHGEGFFPTPFLWPFSNFHIDGVPWAHPLIFIPNVIMLVAFYYYFYIYKKRRAKI